MTDEPTFSIPGTTIPDSVMVTAEDGNGPSVRFVPAPKESALIKPPREVSGDAVGGGTSEVVFGIPMMFYDSSDRTRRMLALADLIDNNPDHHSFSVNGAATLSADLRALAYTPKARPTASDGEARERIARIVSPTAAQLRDELAKPGASDFPEYAAAKAMADAQWDAALAKADAILAALPPTDGAGEQL